MLNYRRARGHRSSHHFIRSKLPISSTTRLNVKRRRPMKWTATAKVLILGSAIRATRLQIRHHLGAPERLVDRHPACLPPLSPPLNSVSTKNSCILCDQSPPFEVSKIRISTSCHHASECVSFLVGHLDVPEISI